MEEASSARRQLQFVRQGNTESVEEFAEMVQFLTMDGFHHNTSDIMDQIGTEAFLRGCREKEAARYIIKRNPKSINEALKWIKASMANSRAIYGTRSPVQQNRSTSYAHRQVKFADQTIKPESPAREHEPKAPLVSHSEQSQSLQSDIRDLVSMMGQLLKSGQRPGVSNSSDARYDYRNYDRSPQRVNTFRQRSPTPPYRQRSPRPRLY